MEQILINLVAGALGGVGAGKSSPTFDLDMICVIRSCQQGPESDIPPFVCGRASHETNSLRCHNYGLGDWPGKYPGNVRKQRVGKNGKPLVGAALNSFLKKCKRE